MNKNHTKKLIKKFPRMFRGVNKSPRESLMCFGFECGDGWYNLIKNLCKKLEKIDPDIEVFQVKEKFGGLRFYFAPAWDEAFDIATKAEQQSYKICEKCGKPGRLRDDKDGRVWLKTLCDKCNKEK